MKLKRFTLTKVGISMKKSFEDILGLVLADALLLVKVLQTLDILHSMAVVV